MGLCSTKFGAGSASDVLANTNWIKEVVINHQKKRKGISPKIQSLYKMKAKKNGSLLPSCQDPFFLACITLHINKYALYVCIIMNSYVENFYLKSQSHFQRLKYLQIFFLNYFYRVIEKEGQKLQGNYST